MLLIVLSLIAGCNYNIYVEVLNFSMRFSSPECVEADRWNGDLGGGEIRERVEDEEEDEAEEEEAEEAEG